MKRSKRIFAVFAVVAAGWACNLPGDSSGSAPLSETQMALAVQQTSLAIQQATFAGQSAATPQPPAVSVTDTPALAPALPAATETSQPQISMEERIKASNILVYEDIVGDPLYVPIVSNTVSSMSFSGGKVVNVGDALGRFRENANSAVKWDLIIVAAEERSSFSGEMFEMMYDHINHGGAVIIEIWYLNRVVSGKISPILRDCGVTLFRDWERGNDYDPYKYSIFWLDTTHPLLSTPNMAKAPSYPYPVWFGDAGDLLELDSGGDAALVGGLYQNRKTDYGVLASCMEGRMVIQTFSSHDYKQDLVETLWENYITYTLTRHYEFIQ